MYCVLCTVYCVLCTVYCVLYTVYCILLSCSLPLATSMSPIGTWNLDLGPWTFDLGLWPVDRGPWPVDHRSWTIGLLPVTASRAVAPLSHGTNTAVYGTVGYHHRGCSHKALRSLLFLRFLSLIAESKSIEDYSTVQYSTVYRHDRQRFALPTFWKSPKKSCTCLVPSSQKQKQEEGELLEQQE
jgi:hypothetical protein